MGLTGVRGIGDTGLRGSTGLTPIVVFGSEFGYAVSEAESSTTSTTYTQKVTYSASLIGGTYYISWYAEDKLSSTNADVRVRVQVDNLTTIAESLIEPKSKDSWFPFGGFWVGYLLSGTHTIDMDYAAESGTASIRKARISIWLS